MAKANAAEAVYENPLIPNARLRQLFRAMLRMRLLAGALGAKRGGKQTVGFEAVLASSSVDLGPGDLVSDVLTGGVIDFLRGATLQAVLHPDKRTKLGPTADCGSAATLPYDLDLQDRISFALGAAAGLKAFSEKKDKAGDKGCGITVVYLQPDETPIPLLRKALALASIQQLPLIFVALEARDGKGNLAAIALQHGIPGMAVDADDAVATYRVMQESIGHARIGGGPALIECVPFNISVEVRKKRPDAITTFENHLLQRGIVSETWVKRERQSLQQRAGR